MEFVGIIISQRQSTLNPFLPNTRQKQTITARKDVLFTRFNTDYPADYQRPSMSVSDIVALKLDGVVSCHYVDRIAFTAIPGFFQGENYLKNAEMAVEDDYNMIDGIINNGPKEPTVAELEAQAKAGQNISLMDLAGAIKRESQPEKKSVVEKLQNRTKP